MTTYVYLVKCPNCEDEFFDFFDEAKEYALGCLSNKPIITQTEVERNDFGECTDHCDLGTVWSWEDMMKDTTTDAEPAKAIFTKDDLKDYIPDEDPEFQEIDFATVNTEEQPIKEEFISVYDYGRMTKDELYDHLVNRQDEVELELGDRGYSLADTGSFSDGGRYSNSRLIVEFDNGKFVAAEWYMSDDGDEMEGHWDFETESFDELWDQLMEFNPENLTESNNILNATRAPKDTDYVIAVRSVSVGSYTFLGMNYKLTTDINKAMTYSSKFAAEEEIKYAIDELQRLGDKYITSYNTDRVFVTTFGKAKTFPGRYDLKALRQHNPAKESCERKPIPEGMTIEELVEAMEENEDTVECTKCGGLFEKASCTHNKEGFGWCCTNCEPADTLVEETEEIQELATIVKDSINHLINDLGKDPWADDFADDVIADIETNYDTYVPEDIEHYNYWCDAVACEVSRQVNNQITEEVEELHDLGNTYDGGYPEDELEDADTYRNRLELCPECGDEHSYDKETGFCINCGFN